MSSVFILNAWDNKYYDRTWVFSDLESAEAYVNAMAPGCRRDTHDIYSIRRNGRYLFMTINECPLDPPLGTASDQLQQEGAGQ